MSDPTPFIAERWCPDCAPNRDPLTEVLQTEYCREHERSTVGSEDLTVVRIWEFLGTGGEEADGANNRLYCDFLHRGSPRTQSA